MMQRVTEAVLSPLRAPEEELRVALVGETDRAVELNTAIGRVRVTFTELGFGHTQRDLRVGLTLRERTGRAVQERAALLERTHDLRHRMFERLIAADGFSELRPRAQVFDRQREDTFAPAGHLRRDEQPRDTLHVLERASCAK